MSTINTIKQSCSLSEVTDSYRKPSFVAIAINWMLTGVAKRQGRIHLNELTDDQLRDIGITRSEARREIARSFWD